MRLEWGPRGAAELVAGGVRTLVVVDVLSFTTSVTVAVERGTAVRPYPWDLASAVALDAELDAVCAVGPPVRSGRVVASSRRGVVASWRRGVVAADVDATHVVPVLIDGWFVSAP